MKVTGLLAVLVSMVPSSVAAPAATASTPEATTHSDTVHVAPPMGERDADRTSILAALDEVRSGGTVLFAPGTYSVGEFIRVTVPRITLLGHPEGTTLRGCDPDEFREVEVAMVACNGLALTGERQTVRGLTFEHAWGALHIGCCLDLAEQGEGVEPSHVGGHLVEGNTFRASVNGFRVIGDSPEPVVIRDNDFVNVWHAGGVNGRTAHILGNRISVPDAAQVPPNGFPGLALFITPYDTRLDRAFTCAGNIIAGNRVEGHPEGIAITVFRSGASCRENVVRDNTVAVSRVRFSGPSWGVIGIRDETDSTLAGVPITLADLRTEMAEFFGMPDEPYGDNLIHDNLIEGNRIVGGEGLGVEILRASGNRIIDNTITGITVRDPFPGNTMYVPPAWSAGNGSGIWVSPGSDGNEIVGNTFDDIASHAVVLEGDHNQVDLRSAADSVKDLGSGNRVTVRAVVGQSGSQPCRQPPNPDDGWTTAAPEDFGLACAPLVEMTGAIRRDDYRNVHAVLVAKDGRLVYEEYFPGTDRRPESSDYSATVTHTFDRNTLHTTRSAGKSFTSALVGVALASGAIPSVEQPVLEFFPELADVADPAAREITLEHVLTMSAGFDWNEGDVPYTNPVNHERALSESDDPAHLVLSREVVAGPGSRWDYNSGLPMLLGLVIHRATGQAFGTYAREHLFAPLGVQRVDWTGPPAWADHPAFIWDGDEPWRMTRSTQPAGSLWLRPRDMLKFGQLYLDGGRWNGRQVLPEAWVAASLEARVPRSRRPIEYPNGAVRHGAYGYQWWYDRFELPYGEVTVHSASGNGGQKIWVLPELGVTAVHLAGNYNVPGNGWEAERLLLERIVPWAMGVRTDYRHQPSLAPMAVDPERWPPAMLPDAERARYLGSYKLDGQLIEIRELDGRLQLLPPIGMGPVDLIPQGDHVFALGLVDDGEVRRIFTPEERYVFVFDEDGRVVRFEIRGPDGVTGIGERVR